MANRQVDVNLRFAQVPAPQLELWLGLAWLGLAWLGLAWPTGNREKTPHTSTPMDADFTADLQFNEFHQNTQEDLNYLVRDLNLDKSKSELLGSRVLQ